MQEAQLIDDVTAYNLPKDIGNHLHIYNLPSFAVCLFIVVTGIVFVQKLINQGLGVGLGLVVAR